MRCNKRVFLLASVVFFFAAVIYGHAAKLEVHSIPGVTLRDNPLGDPPARRVAVFAPAGISAAGPLPLVIYLPGWGGSSEGAIAEGNNGMFGQAVDILTTRGYRVRIAVVDGRSRYGGSQFLNSAATGNYADYISEEILPALKAIYGTPKGTHATIVAGHSSGGYGALMLAISQKEKFGAVVALSPDSDFETTHKPLAQAPSARNLTREEVYAAMAWPPEPYRLPQDGHAQLILGLCANYAPIPKSPGHFEWLYDEKGKWLPEVWQRWLNLDPLNVIKSNENAFAPKQRIYLDGAQHDEFGANIGAAKIYEVLRSRKSPTTFYESPGHHSDHLLDRLVRGLTWVMKAGEKPTGSPGQNGGE